MNYQQAGRMPAPTDWERQDVIRRTFYPVLAGLFLHIMAAWAGDTPAREAGKDAHPVAVQVDFAKTGVPFLAKHCFECHGDKKQEGEISYTRYKDEESVLKARKLFHKVLKVLASGEMPPEKQPRPAPAEIEAFARTVNAIFDKADRNAKPDPGQVAMRRLNRVEYNNTLRDLLGVDFNAAEDFPSDEVGHGFDNISDAQWISPVLMERYLSAAETVAQRSVAVVRAPSPYRHQGGRYLEPAGPNVPTAKYRPISGDKPGDPIFTGPLHTPFQVPGDGEYKFKAKVYAQAQGDQPVWVAVLACGRDVPKPASDEDAARLWGAAVKNLRPFQILKIEEVYARSEGKAQTIEVRVPANTNLQRVALALRKPADGAPVPKLFVEGLALDGPLDTRPAFHRKNLDCPPDVSKEEHTREVLRNFVYRAFRRPASPEETARLVKIVEAAEARGEKWEAGIQLAIQSVLVSPKFLFRPECARGGTGFQPAKEIGQDARATAGPLNEFELASRLSYFLWSSMPDDELFKLAEQGDLGANLDAQVRRMLKDPKSRALVDNFAMQWLQLGRLNAFAADAAIFPKFSTRLRDSMAQETILFLDAVFREDRSILDLIEADFTFLNETLAQHYGIVDTNGNRAGRKAARPPGEPFKRGQFQRVSLADGERGGLLTQASVLTVTSNPTRTSPVKRGKWVLEQLLGTPPPPPPPNVPDLESGAKLTGTLRQRMEQHRANASCANCHARMDPIGFAFENFDAIGGWRTKDAGQPIDPSGVLPDGSSFKGHGELKKVLKEKKDLFARCLAEKLLTFALGRGLEDYDKRSVDRIVEALAKDGYRFSTLAVEIARSDAFRMRRGSE